MRYLLLTLCLLTAASAYASRGEFPIWRFTWQIELEEWMANGSDLCDEEEQYDTRMEDCPEEPEPELWIEESQLD